MKEQQNCRLGRVGGQAVIEGVMMKAGESTATACRLPDGSIKLHRDTFVSLRKKHKICNLPLLRGVINFIEMLMLSMKTLTISAEALGEVDQPETKFEKWMREKLHINVMDLATGIGMVLGVLLSVGLFIFLPRFLADLFFGLFSFEVGAVWFALFEGILKVGIFVCYLLSVCLMKEMRRVFAYHGAEHKSVACYESGEELTPANAMHHTRFHPRCGTSFMFVMILLGIFVGVLINVWLPELKDDGFVGTLLYTLIKLLILPLVVGLGFEFIMYAGKHNNLIVRMLSAPGLWMQRITTKEPDEQMLEIAITALKCAMPEEFPDFDPATYDRSPKADEPTECEAEESVDKEAPADETDTKDAASVITEADTTEDHPDADADHIPDDQA